MKRILIIGSGGSGKSTLARRLGKATGIEVFHLDGLYWQPGWIEPDKAEWAERIRILLEKDSWIIDGNYSGTLEMRMAAADTVVFLDIPRMVCIRRILKRAIRYRGTNRPDMAEGCNEKLDLKFLAWIWNYPRRTKSKVESLLKKFENDIDIVRLCSQRGADDFLAGVTN